MTRGIVLVAQFASSASSSLSLWCVYVWVPLSLANKKRLLDSLEKGEQLAPLTPSG